jgi:hypothetical protein
LDVKELVYRKERRRKERRRIERRRIERIRRRIQIFLKAELSSFLKGKAIFLDLADTAKQLVGW